MLHIKAIQQAPNRRSSKQRWWVAWSRQAFQNTGIGSCIMAKMLSLSPLNRCFIEGSLGTKKLAWEPENPEQGNVNSFCQGWSNLTCSRKNVWILTCERLKSAVGAFGTTAVSLGAPSLLTSTAGWWRTIICFRKLSCLSSFSPPRRCARGVRVTAQREWRVYGSAGPSLASDTHCFQTLVGTKQG